MCCMLICIHTVLVCCEHYYKMYKFVCLCTAESMVMYTSLSVGVLKVVYYCVHACFCYPHACLQMFFFVYCYSLVCLLI